MVARRFAKVGVVLFSLTLVSGYIYHQAGGTLLRELFFSSPQPASFAPDFSRNEFPPGFVSPPADHAPSLLPGDLSLGDEKIPLAFSGETATSPDKEPSSDAATLPSLQIDAKPMKFLSTTKSTVLELNLIAPSPPPSSSPPPPPLPSASSEPPPPKAKPESELMLSGTKAGILNFDPERYWLQDDPATVPLSEAGRARPPSNLPYGKSAAANLKLSGVTVRQNQIEIHFAPSASEQNSPRPRASRP